MEDTTGDILMKILMTTIAVTLLVSLLLNFLLGCLLAMLTLKGRHNSRHKPQSATPPQDEEAFANRLSTHNYSLVRPNGALNEAEYVTYANTATVPPDEVLELELNPLYIPVEVSSSVPSEGNPSLPESPPYSDVK